MGYVQSGLWERILMLFPKLLQFRGIMQKGKRIIYVFSTLLPPHPGVQTNAFPLCFFLMLIYCFCRIFCSRSCWLLGANKMWMCPRLTLTEAHTVLQWLDFLFLYTMKRTKNLHLYFCIWWHRYRKITFSPRKTFSKWKIVAIPLDTGAGGGG